MRTESKNECEGIWHRKHKRIEGSHIGNGDRHMKGKGYKTNEVRVGLSDIKRVEQK